MKREWLAILLALLWAHTARAGAEIIELEREYEHHIQSLFSQKFPFGEGYFYALERVGERDLTAGRKPHRLIAIGAATGKKLSLTKPSLDIIHPRFFSGDYVISIAGPYNQVSVHNRATGAHLGSKRLKDRVLDARVQKNILYLLQSGKSSVVLSRFLLPGMEFISEDVLTTTSAAKPIKFAGDQFIGFGRHNERNDHHLDFGVLTHSRVMQEKLRLELASRPGRSCGIAIEASNDKYAVIKRGCGHYTVVDVTASTVKFDIPANRDSDFLDLALTDKYLFVRPHPYAERGRSGASPVSIFELSTGRELAKQALPRGELLSHAGKLLLKNRKGLSLKVAVYKVNEDHLFKPERANQEIQQAAIKARETDDPYDALRVLEAIPLDAIDPTTHEALSKDMADITAFYGRLLAYNPRTSGEGLALLGRLAASRPKQRSLSALRDLAKLRNEIYATDDRIRESVLSETWRPADERPLLSSREKVLDINYGRFPSQVYFHGDRIFIPCYNCDKSGLAGVKIFDRATWRYLTTLPVMRPNGDKQQNISAIEFAADSMFVSLANRYPDESDINLFVFDLNTLEQRKSWSEEANGALFVSGEKTIGVCDCRRDRCRAYDARSLLEISEQVSANAVCTNPFTQSQTITLDLAERVGRLGIDPVYVSPRYAVRDVATHPMQKYVFYPIDGAGDPITFPVAVTHLAWRAIFFSTTNDFAAIGDASLDMVRFYGFDLADQSYRTLIEMPREKYQGAATDGTSLFMAFDGSVLAIDVKTGEVRDFAYVFEGADIQAGGRRFKRNISRMLVDQGKLVVLARGGVASIINLEEFYARADKQTTPYSSTARKLLNH